MPGPCDKELEGHVPGGMADVSEYLNRTRDVQARHGGNPECSSCHEPMTPIDDHGRFVCTNFNCSRNAGLDFGQIMTGGGGNYGFDDDVD